MAAAARALNGLLTLINKGEQLTEQNVRYVISLVGEGNEEVLSSMTTDSVCVTAKGRPVKPKTVGQKRYCESIAKTPSPLAWARPVPAKLTWLWQWRLPPFVPKR